MRLPARPARVIVISSAKEVHPACFFHTKPQETGMPGYIPPMVLTFAAGDFNSTCFRAKNVVYLQYGSAGTGQNRPFFVKSALFSDKTIPMTGKTTCHVAVLTCHVVSSGPICREQKETYRVFRPYGKVKNVNVG